MNSWWDPKVGEVDGILGVAHNEEGPPRGSPSIRFMKTGRSLAAVGGKRPEQNQEVGHGGRPVVVEVRRTVVLSRHLTGAVIHSGVLVVVVGLRVGTTVAVIRAALVVEQGDGRIVACCAIRAAKGGAIGRTRGAVVHPAALPIVRIVIVQRWQDELEGGTSPIWTCREHVAEDVWIPLTCNRDVTTASLLSFSSPQSGNRARVDALLQRWMEFS